MIEGERFYKISNVNHMADFFMTIVSYSDHWMFISSNGSLSAGRKDRDNALFPYYSDDKIQDYHGITGSRTLLLIERNAKTYLWEPFSKKLEGVYSINRNLYKSEYGDRIIFEEVNNDLETSFQYSWSSSEKFGFVRNSRLENLGDTSLEVKLLDGIANILPSGVDYNFQNEFSNLLDGYKKNELVKETGLGLFMLSSIPVDRAEPSESLFATTVWSAGLDNCLCLISERQVNTFKAGGEIKTEVDVRASRGAFLVHAELEVGVSSSKEWIMVAEVNQDAASVMNLNEWLKDNDNLIGVVHDDIKAGTEKLVRTVATADGLQVGHEDLSTARHFSNVLFNVMRGGVYLDGYLIESADFIKFLSNANKQLKSAFGVLIHKLPERITHADLLKMALETQSADFIRLTYEYLPLTFSRRHGDPSRPWNRFSIENRNPDGSLKSDFQGNWRDIFQNWEALSLSYPGYIENIIAKFVNASTADGYNPYRIMRNGIDWECPDPHDPWAYIGYWGDHQIIYLQKLLELSENYHPGLIDSLLQQDIFAYANVPYRIKAYEDIVANPKDTIEFDFDLNEQIKNKVAEIGSDGRLLLNNEGLVFHVNLAEKILVTLLAKLSNFIPEAGIWLNTQRPEWNDANNALVGNGVSMVTLYYLRRFVNFWHKKFAQSDATAYTLSTEIKMFFDQVNEIFRQSEKILEKGFTDEERRTITDQLGQAGAQYRHSVYSGSLAQGKSEIDAGELSSFMQLILDYIDQSINTNRRDDGLYHAYNLVSFKGNGILIRHLYEMLEGQVAVLSSGLLSTEQCLDVLDSLKSSKLYREDQYSYILYPDRELPRFINKNNIPPDQVRGSGLLTKLLENNDSTIVSEDQSGQYHFNSHFRNAEVMKASLEKLDKKTYGTLLDKEGTRILELYEKMFDHQSFTGRSGTFYAYEGLGSIYWHMVSKLLLAVEEGYFKAVDESAPIGLIGRLKDHYYEIKAGIGLYKSPALYGAFPTDPYSHTPGHAGAKQPGMTGQVKEDVISRMGELGVRVQNGQIVFDTSLINPNELLKDKSIFEFYSADGVKNRLDLNANQLGFTVCQVPVIYSVGDADKVSITFKNGDRQEFAGLAIDRDNSDAIFNRNLTISLIEVSVRF